MRLLFDQNISFRILRRIEEEFPEARQVIEIGLKDSTDLEIWGFAKSKDYVVVTFDSDFMDIANLKGHPPKIIWLRIGNTTTLGVAELIISKVDLINDFIHASDFENIACLELG